MIARRTFLRGSTVLPIAGALPAAASVLSPADARLVALADAYQALDREVSATSLEAPGFGDLISRYAELEVEAAEIPADSLAGVTAKARLCQSPAARGCADYGHVLSVVDDLWRLFGGGAHG